MLHVLLLIAACAGETTAPEAPATPTSPTAPRVPLGFRVLPGTVTIEAGQRIRFRGEFRTLEGRVAVPLLSWEASGGQIDSAGTFFARQPGTYRIVARGRGRGREHPQRPDTSVVVVVPRQPDLAEIRVAPRAAEMRVGETRSFTATGLLDDGESVPIGVVWTATGGTIDPAGSYEAWGTPGEYRVSARSINGKVADTVRVMVLPPMTPDTTPGTPGPTPDPSPAPSPDPTPEPSPDPTPAPTIARVVLKPASIVLTTLATQKFAAFGRTSTGDSVAVEVTFRATGGTISSTGLYTAGQTAGIYRVIATSNALADTSVVTLGETSGGGTPPPPPPPAPGGGGIPMGIFGLLSYDVAPGAFTMAVDGYSSGNILDRIDQARRMKLRLFLNMTGGSHLNYMTGGVFDMAKWRAKMDTYNTAAIRQAVAAAVADGIIVGNSVMDEPANTSPTNSWGPAGTMTKARVDDMCRYVKNMFPTLPVGVLHDHRIFEPEKGYQSCEFLVSQYRLSKGDVRDFRDGGLAFARRYNMSIIFSLNILHGGDPGTTCEKWGDDPQGILCPMSATQLRDWGTTLGSAGCALMMWKYEREYVAKPEIQTSLATIGESLAMLPRRLCIRT